MPDKDQDEICPAWWRDIQAANPKSKPTLLSFQFAAAAQDAQDKTARAVLSVLGLATSPMLRPVDWNEPFQPMMELVGRRSPLPSDLDAEQKALLRRVAELMDDSDEPALRARVCDVCWTYGDRGDVLMLERAISSYAAVPLEPDDWHGDGRDEWHRGLELVKRRGKSGHTQLMTMASALRTRLESTAEADGFFPVQLSETLRKYRLVGKEAVGQLGSLCKQRAVEARAGGQLHLERAWDEEATAWFAAAGLKDDAAASQVRVAESFAAEAEGRRQGPAGTAMAAGHFVEQAIKVLRALPRSYRTQHGVDALMSSLRTQLHDDRQSILEGMLHLQSDPLDITELVKHARDKVSGLSPVDALISLGSIHRVKSVDAAVRQAQEGLQAHPLAHLIASETYSSGGQKVAASSGANLSGSTVNVSGANDPRIWSTMIRDHTDLIDLVVSARIAPALEVVTMQHRFSIELLYDLCHNNPWIPARHELTWARGLLHGLNSDFATATCVLVPQLEHFVRHQLKLAGAHTLHEADNGVEIEKGLTALLDDPKTIEIFGQDLTFEMAALLTEQQGPNLRNTIAHGLATDNELRSQPSAYAWWLALQFATLPYTRDTDSPKSRQQSPNREGEGEAGGNTAEDKA